MSDRTIPRPRQPLRTGERVKPNRLFPLQEARQPLKYPALPCPPRDHRFTDTYTVSTHLIPAAFPRVSPFVPLLPVPEHESKDERRARIERYTDAFLALQTQHAPDKSESQPTVLWTALNRYVCADTRGTGLTLLLLHANGLHKEVSREAYRLYLCHDDCRPSSRRYAIYLKQWIMTSDTRLTRFGPLMLCNTATPGSSTPRTSGHSVSCRIFLTFSLLT